MRNFLILFFLLLYLTRFTVSNSRYFKKVHTALRLSISEFCFTELPVSLLQVEQSCTSVQLHVLFLQWPSGEEIGCILGCKDFNNLGSNSKICLYKAILRFFAPFSLRLASKFAKSANMTRNFFLQKITWGFKKRRILC